MLSLKERFDLLERDLVATPMRISSHSDLPFAILRYESEAEWEMRQHVRRLMAVLEQTGKTPSTISLAELLWRAIDETEGLDAIAQLERDRGFPVAQDQVTTYLDDPEWLPLPDTLAERLHPLDPARSVVFLMRASAMAPAIYQMSRLLDEMQGRTRVPTILCYPGSLEGTICLRYMDLADREALGNYRVKVYG